MPAYGSAATHEKIHDARLHDLHVDCTLVEGEYLGGTRDVRGADAYVAW